MYFSLEWNSCHFNRAVEELVSSSPCTWALFKYLCSFVSFFLFFFFLLLSVNKTFMDVQVSLGGRWNAAALDLNHRTSSSFVVFLGSESWHFWEGRSEMAQRVTVLFTQNERSTVKSKSMDLNRWRFCCEATAVSYCSTVQYPGLHPIFDTFLTCFAELLSAPTKTSFRVDQHQVRPGFLFCFFQQSLPQWQLQFWLICICCEEQWSRN